MRVLMVPMDLSACGFYRILEPTRIAADIGVDVRAKGENLEVVADIDNHTQATKVREFREDCDVLVLQRPLAQNVHSIAVQAKAQGIRIVVELDDDLHAVHNRNSMAPAVDGRLPLHHRDWVTRTLALADLLIVSTPALTRYAPEKAVVVRNRLPEACLALHPAVSPARHQVGWTGALNVHPEDMQATQGAIGKLRRQFTVVGSAAGVADALKIAPQRVTLGAAWQDSIPAYWKTVPDHIGVGVAPLQPSGFNEAKSALKIQEMATLGIPFVASPTGEYRWFVAESGAGIIARTRAEWVAGLRTLLNDDDAYERHRAAGLAWAAEHTMERHIGEWLRCWERAYDMGRNHNQTVIV
jgi:O-antigen biosynthesis protein